MNLRLLSFVSIALVVCHSCVWAGNSDAPSSAGLPAISAIGKDLGVQVTRAMMMRGDTGLDKIGRPVVYTVLLGAPAVLSVVDVQSAKVVGEYPLQGTSGAWGVKVSTDGTVYLGAYNKGLLYRFFPKTGELRNLGPPFKTEDTVLYPMDVSADGKVYGGSYPSGHAYEYDPKTEKFRDLGDMTTVTAKERWIRVTALDREKNKLYFGIGNQPQLVECDLASGKKRELLSPKYGNITAVYDLNLEAGRLFCRKETHNPYEYFVIDAETGQDVLVTNADTGETSDVLISGSRGFSPKSPESNKMYYIGLDRVLYEYDLDANSYKSLKINMGSVATGYSWVKLNDVAYPGYTLVGTLGNGGALYRFNPQSGKYDTRPVEYTGQPVNIRETITGPDGKIYSGGYLAGNMGIYDPKTDKVTHLGGSGQTEGLAFVGKKLYMGVYPSAGIFEYDTEQPWNTFAVNTFGTSASRNPSMIFSLENNEEISGYTNQDRPFAMTGSDEMQKLFAGTVPKNGMLGGALAVYDVKTREKPRVYWNVVPDQSIVSLVCKDGVLYGGTSIYGGMGVTPKAKEGKLFVWDIAAGKMLNTLVPIPAKAAVNRLTAGPDGNIWGTAGGILFSYDPKSKSVTRTLEAVPGANGHYSEGSLIVGKDGNLYGTASDKLFRYSPQTNKVELLAAQASKVSQDLEGLFYVVGGPITNLFQVREWQKGAANPSP